MRRICLYIKHIKSTYFTTISQECKWKQKKLTYHKAESFCTDCTHADSPIPLKYNNDCKHAADEP